MTTHMCLQQHPKESKPHQLHFPLYLFPLSPHWAAEGPGSRVRSVHGNSYFELLFSKLEPHHDSQPSCWTLRMTCFPTSAFMPPGSFFRHFLPLSHSPTHELENTVNWITVSPCDNHNLHISQLRRLEATWESRWFFFVLSPVQLNEELSRQCVPFPGGPLAHLIKSPGLINQGL